MPTLKELQILQKLPLDAKIFKTQQRIQEWANYYGTDGFFVSFSGGKDSTVLLHIVRQMYPDVEAVFVDTGLEYPEIRQFVKTFENVTILRPKLRFDQVIKKYGYPFISKDVSDCVYQSKSSLNSNASIQKYTYRLQRLVGTALDKNKHKSIFNIQKYKPLLDLDFDISNICCNVMKKTPVHTYMKKTGKVQMTAQTTEESVLRQNAWIKNGCNGFNMKNPISNPMSFWTEQDILQYIKQFKVKIASVYGTLVNINKNGNMYKSVLKGNYGKLCTTGCNRTGCIFCAFGAHLEKGESRFQRLKRTHPRQYEYCMNGGAYQWQGRVQTSKGWKNIDFINEDGSQMSYEQIEEYVQLHQDDEQYRFRKLWKPTKRGLGMKHCINELNKIYGANFIKY